METSKVTRTEKARLRRESQVRLEKTRCEMVAIVATGCCPKCGAGLRRNLSLTGWWQCDQFGADGFRADSSKPPCHFQGFTE